MRKYDPWRALFERATKDELRFTISDLEARLGSKLPPSARSYQGWWHGHQHNIWEQYGFKAAPSLGSGQVVFRRTGVRRPSAAHHVDHLQGNDASENAEGQGGPGPGTEPSSGDWRWEGAVQASIVSQLARDGWSIRSVADTAARAVGTDIVAFKNGQSLRVEVKGYPTSVYARGERKGEPKPTHPATQARHWYAGALLRAAIERGDHPTDLVAIGLPDAETYRNLVTRTQLVLLRSQIDVIWVHGAGVVEFPIRLGGGT